MFLFYIKLKSNTSQNLIDSSEEKCAKLSIQKKIELLEILKISKITKLINIIVKNTKIVIFNKINFKHMTEGIKLVRLRKYTTFITSQQHKIRKDT